MGSETKKSAATFPLRLPRSTRQAAVELAKAEGLSLNQFITLAVVEKVARMEALESGLHGPHTIPEGAKR